MKLEVELLDRLSEPVRDKRAGSVSDIIRTALERFDFENVVVVRPNQLQISVRLPGPIRASLKRVSRRQHVSVGQLVRAAVEAYLPALEAVASGQLEIPIPTADSPDVPNREKRIITPKKPEPRRERRPASKRRRKRRTARARPMTKKRKG